MAVWMASMAKDLPGKIVAIWFPISAFVALGLEHSVANMACTSNMHPVHVYTCASG